MSIIGNTVGRDRYLELVKRFPLVPLRTEREYDAAVACLKKLAIRDEESLDAGEEAYLEALTLFVEDYQDEHHRTALRRMGPLQALKYLMAESGMRPVDLGRVVGNRSLASQILNGRRELSKANVVALAKHFHVGAGVFLQA